MNIEHIEYIKRTLFCAEISETPAANNTPQNSSLLRGSPRLEACQLDFFFFIWVNITFST